ncbi:RNA exonuclease 1 homolog isoform X1 [Acipenser ruthenus]|uniref:RNA exonuclease 1 homolog isoform X1 n=1 Tax=Acipenser ruthenus TaxID=7906 RepID=UPI0027420B44|nr:RNA exonuclease 1 homolog isoform X1 [Acipenser ruthenus]
MLRTTGFFRGIDCPFINSPGSCVNNNNNNAKNGGELCSRPYCHFRHSKPRRASCKESKARSSTQQEQGCDPYSPEVTRPAGQNGEESTRSDSVELEPSNLELELVNRAIEAVKSEVEREQKKLSWLEDVAEVKGDAYSSLEYDPSSYQISAVRDYNPTPHSSKYTLDPDSKSKGNSLEYVPAVVSKAAIKKAAPSALICNKYTIDKTKPTTDLEYDPLSNYSARHLNKKNAKDQKRGRRNREVKEEEGYVPTAKKPRRQTDFQKYEVGADFSESDDENGTGYRPSPISRLQRGSFSDDETGDSGNREGKERAAQHDPEDTDSAKLGEQEGKSREKKESSKASDKKMKAEKVKNGEKEPSGKKNKEGLKERGGKKGEEVKSSSSKEAAKKDRNDGKKENKSKGGDKVNDKDKSEEKEVKQEKGQGGSSGKKEKHAPEGARKEKPKVSDSSCGKKGDGTSKAAGRGDRSKKDPSGSKDLKNGKQGSKEKKTGSKESVKEGQKSSSTKEEGKRPQKIKLKQRTLSHVDLFGDESGDEDHPGQASSSSKGDSFQGKRKTSKRKASAFSSSEDEIEEAEEEEEDDRDYSSLQNELDYEEDPMEECLRIFNESNDVKTEDKGRQAKQAPSEPPENGSTDDTLTTLFPGQKKRVSHFACKGDVEAAPKQPVRPYRRATAQETCYKRIQMAQQQAVQLAAAAKTAATTAAYAGEKKRIAHRPTLAAPAAKCGPVEGRKAGSNVASPSRSGSSSLTLKAHTSASFPSKTTSTAVQRRIAHTPTLKNFSSLKRPIIPTEFGAKVPTNVRQRYLNLFIDECLKFCSSEEGAFEKALAEEKVVYDRSSNRNIYLNVAVNTLKKLRGQSTVPTSPTNKPPSVNKKSLSHEELLGGRLAAKTSFTLNLLGKPQEEELTGATLYRKMREYLMTEEQLQEHGYPRPNPDRPGGAIVHTAAEKKVLDPFTKVCCRCGSEYTVSATGNCVRREECTFHWGRLRRQRAPDGWETQYSCCSGAVGSTGCQVSKQHVQDARKENLDGYVQTFDKPASQEGNPGVYALDCEMCYTKQGLELTRVTVINSDLKVIYDTFVKPDSKVVDYNTRFSGVTEEDLENTTITIRDVQAVLLSMFSADSILIGHSLESDLLALKLIHSRVVDTAIVFPHRLGLPYKRALRTVMADYLKRIIQDNVEGHDSSEDASACMELMIWKIKEDAKVKR